MKQLTFFFALFLLASNARSQNTDCRVLADSLSGTYEGGCKNGKASGSGKATGAHIYTGDFKAGLPDGKGKYNWPNGDVYEGNFKNGLKEGYGEFRKAGIRPDSVMIGYWKKDVYKGRYEKPYIIHNTTINVGRVEVNKTGNSEKTVTVSVSLLAGTGGLTTRNNQTLVRLTDVQVIRGLFMYKGNTTISNKDITVFRGVEFPFRARFFFGTTQVDVEFFEAGEWEVNVPIL